MIFQRGKIARADHLLPGGRMKTKTESVLIPAVSTALVEGSTRTQLHKLIVIALARKKFSALQYGELETVTELWQLKDVLMKIRGDYGQSLWARDQKVVSKIDKFIATHGL